MVKSFKSDLKSLMEVIISFRILDFFECIFLRDDLNRKLLASFTLPISFQGVPCASAYNLYSLHRCGLLLWDSSRCFVVGWNVLDGIKAVANIQFAHTFADRAPGTSTTRNNSARKKILGKSRGAPAEANKLLCENCCYFKFCVNWQ